MLLKNYIVIRGKHIFTLDNDNIYRTIEIRLIHNIHKVIDKENLPNREFFRVGDRKYQ
jgi:hypothetical protein